MIYSSFFYSTLFQVVNTKDNVFSRGLIVKNNKYGAHFFKLCYSMLDFEAGLYFMEVDWK